MFILKVAIKDLEKHQKASAGRFLQRQVFDFRGFHSNGIPVNFSQDEFLPALVRSDDKDPKDEKSYKDGMTALASVVAAHPMIQISKLVRIANNSSYPQEVRTLAASLLLDAMSHMKQRQVDGKSAKSLLNILSSAGSSIRELIFLAFKDTMKMIEEALKREKERDYKKSYNGKDVSTIGQSMLRSLTLA